MSCPTCRSEFFQSSNVLTYRENVAYTLQGTWVQRCLTCGGEWLAHQSRSYKTGLVRPHSPEGEKMLKEIKQEQVDSQFKPVVAPVEAE